MAEGMEEEAYNQNQEQFPYEQEYESWAEEPLYSRPSQDKAYNVYDFEEITKKIYEDNNSKVNLTGLPPQWNIMLYYFCNFSQHQLNNVIDQEFTGRKMIRYDQNYQPSAHHGDCMICCEESQLVSNTCGHSFCLDCWRDMMRTNHSDRNVYELFPLCPCEGCYHRVNFKLMKKIWEIYPLERRLFDKLLCLKYSQKNEKVRMCGREGCNKAILINFGTQRTLHCDCGYIICRICGQAEHYPLDCGDLKTWNKLANNKEQQWLNGIVHQACPMCKTPIDKNGGCIHMTCKCGHSFCWICLQVWSGHQNYGECSSVRKQDHEKKLMEQMQKKKLDQGSYNERFLQAQSQIDRIQHILKRVSQLNLTKVIQELNSYHILTNDLLRLEKIKQIILDALHLQFYAQIYVFLQRDGYKELQGENKYFFKLTSKLDDYLIGKSTVVERTKKELTELNKAKVILGEILIEQVRKKFFVDWDYFHELLANARKIYDQIKMGKFMKHK